MLMLMLMLITMSKYAFYSVQDEIMPWQITLKLP